MLYEHTMLDKCDYEERIINLDNGIDFIPANEKLANFELYLTNLEDRETVLHDVIEPLKKIYDFIIIDCRPSLGLLTINALGASNSVMIPTQAEYLSTSGTKQLISTIMNIREEINPTLTVEGILITMTDLRTNLSKNIKEQIVTEYGKYFPVFPNSIPRRTALAESIAQGMNIFEYSAKNEGAIAYQLLSKEVEQNAKKECKRHRDTNTR